MKRMNNMLTGFVELEPVRGLLVLIAMLCVQCMTAQPYASPTATYWNAEEESDVTLDAGDNTTTNAPCELRLASNLGDAAGWRAVCEWRIYKTADGVDKPMITRFEEQTTVMLTQSGGYGIKLFVTLTDMSNSSNVVELECDPITVNITESRLSCPDGFSPNDDGINDVWRVTYQSIVKMDGVIFNRWGQKVYSFNLSNVDQGWDGRWKGDYVKDGVYYLNLQAVGSDGVKYDIKKALNVLTGYRETR